MKIILMFLSIGLWKLKYTNDFGKHDFHYLEIRDRNEIVLNKFPWNKKYAVYDEVCDNLKIGKNTLNCQIIMNQKSLSLINFEKKTYYNYEPVLPQKNYSLQVVLATILLFQIYQIILTDDLLSLVIRNIMSNHI